MRKHKLVISCVVAVSLVGAGAAFAAISNRTAGPRPDGTAITPVGYQVTPAGDQTRLGNLPLNTVLHPDGRHLLVTNNGQGVQSLQLVDTDTNTVVQTLPFPSPESLYIGLAWSPDGKTAYASAAANSKIRVLSFADGKLSEGTPISVPTTTPEGQKITLFPAGLDVTLTARSSLLPTSLVMPSPSPTRPAAGRDRRGRTAPGVGDAQRGRADGVRLEPRW